MKPTSRSRDTGWLEPAQLPHDRLGAPDTTPTPEHVGPHGRRGRRWLAIASIPAALVALAAAASWWVISTPSGAKWTFERLGAALPGELTVDTLLGPIRGPLYVRGLTYKTERMIMTIDRVRLDWKLRELVHQRLDIRQLDADSVNVVLSATARPVARQDTAAKLPDVDLPLDVMIGRGHFRDIRITPVGSTEPIVIDDLRLAETAFRDTLRIGALSATSRYADVEIRGGGRAHGPYSVDLLLTWAYHRPGGDDIVGRGRMVGTLDTLRVEQVLSHPLAAHVNATVYRPLVDMRLDAEATFANADLHRIDPSLPAGRATGRVEMSGRPLAFRSTGAIDARTVDWGPLRATYTLDRTENVLHIRDVRVRPSGRNGQLAARGNVTFHPKAPVVSFAGTWTEMGWPLRGEESVHSRSGTFQLSGTTERYRLTSDAELSTAQIPSTRWKVEGIGGPRSLDFSSVSGQALGGSVTGNGRVTWIPEATWNFDLAARGIDPSTVWPRWPGALDADLQTSGTAAPGGARGDVVVQRLEGRLRDQPVQGMGTLHLVPGGYAFSGVDLGLGPNRFTADGTAARAWDVRWNLNARDLSAIQPYAAGSIVASGTITGAYATPRIQGTATGDSLRWKNDWVQHVTATADVNLDPSAPSQLDVDATQITLPTRGFEHASIRGAGAIRAHQLTFETTSAQDSVRVGVDGGLFERTWRGRLTALDVVSPVTGAWSLEAPANLVASGEHVTLGDFAWHSGGSRIAGGGTWEPNRWSVQSRIENVSLDLAEPALPHGVDLTGDVSGTVDFAHQGGVTLGDARLDVGPGQISHPTGTGKRATVPLDASTITIHGDAQSIAGDARFSFGPTGTFEGRMRVPQVPGSARTLDGRFAVHIRDLGLIEAFVPEASNTRGTLDADLEVQGTVSRPRWIGEAHLASAAADVTRLGVQLRDIGITAKSDAAGRLVVDGSMRSGTGVMKIQGEASVDEQGRPRAHVTLIGDRVQAANTREALVEISPNLIADVLADSLHLSGEVLVPHGELRGRIEQRTLVAPSPDVVLIGADLDTTPKRAIRTTAEVRLVLGDDVRINAYGLDAKPSGSILAIVTPTGPATATGELRVADGTYRAYGVDLQVERGRLIFGGGPIGNPGVDVRAVRNASDGVVAGFEVRGTLKAPRFSVFSDPPMAERDAIAYAVLGRPLDRTNQSESGIISDAANTLGLRGGSYIAGTFARQLGLDRASIESRTGSFDEAQLSLGTYLSPRVYVNYGVGILDQTSTLRVQYFLNRKWTLQAETGFENAAQVLYTVERGR